MNLKSISTATLIRTAKIAHVPGLLTNRTITVEFPLKCLISRAFMSECKASGAFSDEKWHLMHCESSFIPSAVCFVNCACENVSGASPSSILPRSFALPIRTCWVTMRTFMLWQSNRRVRVISLSPPARMSRTMRSSGEMKSFPREIDSSLNSAENVLDHRS